MRLLVGLLACLGLGALECARANDPATAPPAQPVSASPAPPAFAKTNSSDLSTVEKVLLSHGYKLEMRGTEKVFCHNEAALGTRFATKRCVTAQSLKSSQQDSQDLTRQLQTPGSRMLPDPKHR